MDTLMQYTDLSHTDTTLDIDDTQANVSDCFYLSAHSRLRSVFGYFAERASFTCYDPNEFCNELYIIFFSFIDKRCRGDDPM